MPVTRALLTPISWLWAGATARRIARTTPQDAGAAVVCIGNLTVGGTGKTPVVREIIRVLNEREVPAHVLSRGYGGAEKGPVRVDPRKHAARDVGDEPLMLSRETPVWVARDRLAGAKAAAAAGAKVVVMDDGHQNMAVKKALSLVVVDGETRHGEWPFGDGAVFPAGPMREPLAKGLARADAIVLMLPADVATPDPELMAMFQDLPVLVARLETPPPPPGPHLAFAGVGKPWKVERALQAAGCNLVDFATFPDHFAYDEPTLAALAARARDAGAGLLTTEKDWVRLSPAWREQVAVWPVRAVFENPSSIARLMRQVAGG